ncbi:hypothetical protein V2J09_006783 [Rumex salicifolius]
MAPSTKQASSRDLRHRVLTCLTRLSDRDTQALAVAELESIIPTLTADTFSLFITSVSSTSTAEKPSVRAASLRLLSSISSTHRSNLSHHLPKLVTAALRRLRDPDSSVRAACVSAFASFASDVAVVDRPPSSSFSVSVLRPLAESLSTEQDAAAQTAAALCLAAAIDSSPAPDPAQIAKYLPKWMKLLKSDGFKAKPGLLSLFRSVVRACEIGNGNLLKDLVAILVDFLKKDDWAARKAAAEALSELAVVERDSLSELKASCLKTFETRRFDKVKAAREAMNKMVEVWKEIPDVLEDGSPPPQSQASSKENASGGRYLLRSSISSLTDSITPQSRRNMPLRRSSPPDSAMKTTARNQASLDDTRKTSSPPMNKKLEYKKSADKIVDNSASRSSCMTSVFEESHQGYNQRVLRRGEKESSRSPTADVNNFDEQCRHHHKECEDLSAIRKQLSQIENQQSGLMDLLQTFIRTSQDGMRSLETRVNGLETALTDMSYDMAVSTTRLARSDPPRNSCCLLPSSDFLSSKFWRRSVGEQRRFSFPITTSSVATICEATARSPASSTFKPENRKFNRNGGAGGFIVNPLAEVQADSRRLSEMSSTGFSRGVHNAA